jgi:hypothetical protein
VRLLLPLKMTVHPLEVTLRSLKLLLEVLFLGTGRGGVDLLLKLLDSLLSMSMRDGRRSQAVRRVCRRMRS